MTTDDMREIEAALGVLLSAYDAMDTVRADEARGKLLALIRQKLPQTEPKPFKKTPGAFAKLAEAMQPYLGDAISDEGCGIPHCKLCTQTDDEHERAVEAWRRRATEVYSDDTYAVLRDEIDEALRLMRVRPVYRDLSQVTAADLERYGPAPTMQAMDPSPEWLARHTAAGELDRLRRENDELMRAFTRLRDASVRGGLGPEAARLVSEQGKAAAERAGIKPAQHQG